MSDLAALEKMIDDFTALPLKKSFSLPGVPHTPKLKPRHQRLFDDASRNAEQVALIHYDIRMMMAKSATEVSRLESERNRLGFNMPTARFVQ